MSEFKEQGSLEPERFYEPLPEQIEAAHFAVGKPEVTAPNPDETFAMPMPEPPRWTMRKVSERLRRSADNS